MVRYSDDKKTAFIDGHKFTRDNKTGYYLSSKKIGNKRLRLHVYVWQKYNGDIPEGYHVHHIDMDKSNNEIFNLALVEGKSHIKHHGRKLSDEERERRRINIIQNGVPKARAWHRSKEGFEWHSKRGKENMKMRKEITYACTFCGNEFKSKRIYNDNENKFCCNNCKSAYRRKQGYDNVKKTCEWCGAEYEANKYQKTKYCKNCSDRRVWRRSSLQHGSRRQP